MCENLLKKRAGSPGTQFFSPSVASHCRGSFRTSCTRTGSDAGIRAVGGRTRKGRASMRDRRCRKRWIGRTEVSAGAGIRTRVLTLARSSDNQLHYVRSKCVDSIASYKLYPIRDNPVRENKSRPPRRTDRGAGRTYASREVRASVIHSGSISYAPWRLSPLNWIWCALCKTYIACSDDYVGALTLLAQQ